jgi:hypothetical protein
MRFKVPKRQPESFKASSLYLAGQVRGLSPDRVEFVEGRNLYTTDPRAAAAVMEATAAKSRRCKTPAYHFIITFDPKDAEAGRVTEEVKRDVAGKVLDDMGLGEHQALVYSHKDTDHPHLHFLVNRIHPTRHKAYSRHRDGTRLAEIVQTRAKELGLNVLRNREYGREHEIDNEPTPTDAEYWQAKREDREARMRFGKGRIVGLRALLRDDFWQASSWKDLTQRLNDKGLTLEMKGRGLIITDGEGYAKLSEMGKGVRRDRLQARFEQTYGNFLIERARELAQRREDPSGVDTEGMTPAEKRTVERLMNDDALPPRQDPVERLDQLDMDYRYWSEIDAAYRRGRNRIDYAKRQETYFEERERTNTEWFRRRTVSLLRILDGVYRDPYAAKSTWDILERTHGEAEAERMVKENPLVLGEARGTRIGEWRDAERQEAKRLSRYLGARRRKWREAKTDLERTRVQLERARERKSRAIHDYRMLQGVAGTPDELRKIMIRKIAARSRALDRVTEQAIRRSRFADERKEQLHRAYLRAKERSLERQRKRERQKALGLEIDID